MDYRLQLRHLLHEQPLQEISAELGIDRRLLQDVVACTAHLDTGDLLRLIRKLGGELAVRPHAIPDAAKGEPVVRDLEAGDQGILPSKGLRLEGLFDEVGPVPANMRPAELAEWLVENGVPYVECWRKCLAACLCPFAEPRHLGGSAPDRRCGIQANAIHNLCLTSGVELDLSDPARLERFLSAVLAYSRVAWASFAQSVTAACPRAAASWGQGVSRARLFEAQSVADRGQRFLDQYRSAIETLAKPIRWFVEGESEVAFFGELLKAANGDDFVPSRLQPIGGIGNVKNLRLVLKQAQAEGFEPVVVVDRLERSLFNEAQKLVSDGLLDEQALIVFDKDFESSFPPKILVRGFSAVAGPEFTELVGTAAARCEQADAGGFADELMSLLRARGLSAADARDRANSWKVPAARELATLAEKSLNAWISGDQVEEVEIARVTRDVVWSTLWFGSRPSSSIGKAHA